MSDYFIHSAEPNEAASHYQDFLTSYRQKTGSDYQAASRAVLKLVFGNSRFLELFLIRHPEAADELKKHSLETELPLQYFSHLCKQTLKQKNDPFTGFKLIKYQALLRATVRELIGMDQRITYREWSRTVIAIVKASMKLLLLETTKKYELTPDQLCDSAILSMGKLGGLEVNYSSDIDLIGLYDSDAEFAAISQHEVFERIFSRLGQVLGKTDEHGFLFRVDWDLRPEGRTGVLANSLDAMDAYYATFGADWERQAYVRANVLCQQKTLGTQFLKMMTPFVYRKALEEAEVKRIVDVQILDMKNRIANELKTKKHDGLNIKLDHGGIRDVEFFIQRLQLIYGGRLPNLRSQNTLDALDALHKSGIVPEKPRTILATGYLFLRRIESALQMEDEQQTHLLKSKPDERLKVARRLGYQHPAEEAVAILMEQIDTTRRLISTTFAEFYDRT